LVLATLRIDHFDAELASFSSPITQEPLAAQLPLPPLTTTPNRSALKCGGNRKQAVNRKTIAARSPSNFFAGLGCVSPEPWLAACQLGFLSDNSNLRPVS
jgi:hypothetical protein